MAKRPTVDLSEAMQELAALAGVNRPEEIAFDVPLLQRAAIEGLAGLLFLARRNDGAACKYLVDRLLGEPTVPLSVRAEQMDRDQLREVMRARWSAAWPWKTESELARMLDAMEGQGADVGGDR